MNFLNFGRFLLGFAHEKSPDCVILKEVLGHFKNRSAGASLNIFTTFMNVLTRWGARSRPNRFEPQFALGFTLVEKIAVMALIAILIAIAAPSWITFFSARSLNVAQDEVFQTLRLAQFRAEQTRSTWQFSIRTDSYGFVQIAAHQLNTPIEQILWHDLDRRIQLHPTEMTLHRTGGLYRVQFNHQGRVIGQLGRVTLIQQDNLQMKRCVTVSTLLGAIRKGCPPP